MMERLQSLLAKDTALVHRKDGVLIAKVADSTAGIQLVKKLLYTLVTQQTVLYLSGGSMRVLYELLTRERKLMPGAVGLIDERYGKRFHKQSNEEMIKETGLVEYLALQEIPFYPILQADTSREVAAHSYDKQVHSLHALFSQHIGLLGIGSDGHTAGVPALNAKINIQNAKQLYTTNELVTQYHDTKGHYGERITMSFLGLTQLDFLLVLACSDKKQEALRAAFSEGSEEEIPARFFRRPAIAEKTLVITDQEI